MANKAIIGITRWAETQRELRDMARRPDADYHLNFADAAQLFGELTLARLALLEELRKPGLGRFFLSLNSLSLSK